MMKFIPNYPKDVVAPKGLFLPERGQIGRAVGLMELLKTYVKVPELQEDYEFTIEVSDEVQTIEGTIIGCRDHGEGLILHPAPTSWCAEDIFEIILSAIFGDPAEESKIEGSNE